MYSKFIRNLIIQKRKLGCSYGKISDELGLSRSTVQSLSKYNLKTNKKKIGPKFKISKSHGLKIKRYVANYNTNGFKVNCNRIIEDTEIDISRRTINNWLLRRDYKYQKGAQKIGLTQKHKKDRIVCISEWIQQNISWEKTIFSDEKRFCLDGPDNWSTYIKDGVSFNRLRRQCGGGGLMIWGMLMPNGLIAIKKMEGKQNSAKYIELLKTFAVPIMNLNYGFPYNFVQDNCSIHVSKESKLFLKTQHFRTLNWPAKSPDINLMENIWKMISDMVYMDGQPQNKKILEEKINEAVLKINADKLKVTTGLYATFRTRLTKLLISKGNIINN